MKNLKQKYDIQYALVSGASSGIGLAYAQELASWGVDLVLVSNQKKELENVAETLSKEFAITCHAFYQDLSLDNASQNVFQFCIDINIQIDLLINNAGVFFFSQFIKTPYKTIDLMLRLHVMQTTQMCRIFGEQMCQRKKGYILNMSSMSAWMYMPGIQTYNASKAYIRNLSRALHYEFHPHNVGVTVACPGGIDTKLFNLSPKIRNWALALHILIPTQKFVRMALRKTLQQKPQYIDGVLNHFFIFIVQHFPKRFILWLMPRLKPFKEEPI